MIRIGLLLKGSFKALNPKPYLKDQTTLKSTGPISIYYETPDDILTLNPFRVHVVLEVHPQKKLQGVL